MGTRTHFLRSVRGLRLPWSGVQRTACVWRASSTLVAHRENLRVGLA